MSTVIVANLENLFNYLYVLDTQLKCVHGEILIKYCNLVRIKMSELQTLSRCSCWKSVFNRCVVTLERCFECSDAKALFPLWPKTASASVCGMQELVNTEFFVRAFHCFFWEMFSCKERSCFLFGKSLKWERKLRQVSWVFRRTCFQTCFPQEAGLHHLFTFCLEPDTTPVCVCVCVCVCLCGFASERLVFLVCWWLYGGTSAKIRRHGKDVVEDGTKRNDTTSIAASSASGTTSWADFWSDMLQKRPKQAENNVLFGVISDFQRVWGWCKIQDRSEDDPSQAVCKTNFLPKLGHKPNILLQFIRRLLTENAHHGAAQIAVCST